MRSFHIRGYFYPDLVSLCKGLILFVGNGRRDYENWERGDNMSSFHGSDLIYARGVPDSPSPDPTSFNNKLCTIIIVEIGLCRDLGCKDKLAAKTKKYSPLVAALKKYWGTVELVTFPIG
jgi:hypothetical protein